MSVNSFKHISDSNLVSEYKKNQNQEVISELYLRYQHLIKGTALKYTNDIHLAEDCTSLVYEIICKDVLKYEVKHFKSWLYIVTKNTCLSHYRKNQTQKKHINQFSNESDFMEFQENEDLNNRILKEGHLNKLENCLEKLKNDQKESIRLFYLKGLTYQEIDQKVSWGIKKVKSYIQNGKRNLKICMEK